MSRVSSAQGGQARPRTGEGGPASSPASPSGAVADIVLLAHGSPDPRHRAGVEELAQRVTRLAPSRQVHTAYLEHHPPTPTDIGPRLHRGVVVPVLLTAAHHARVDVPAAVADLARLATGTVTQASPLGPHPVLVQAVVELIEATEGAVDARTGVVVFAAGASHAPAVADLAATLEEHAPDDSGPWMLATVDGRRSLTEVVPMLRTRCERLVAVPLTVAGGILRDRMADQCARHGVPLVAGALSDTDALAQLALLRAATAGVQGPDRAA